MSAMVNEDWLVHLRSALAFLCEPLHDAFVWADMMRAERNPLLADPEYRWHGTHTVRAYAHYQLKGADLGTWRLTGNHARNGELWLSDSSYRARVLHTVLEKEVPPPGPNPQRRAYYRNPKLADFVQEPLFGPLGDRLLLLWWVDRKSGMPAFRVVRPIGNWNWGRRSKTDVDFILPPTAEEMLSLKFSPSDGELELLIPGDDEGVEDAGGLTG
jgi:hypothetical protein